MLAETVKETISDLLFFDGKPVLEIKIQYPRAEGHVTGDFERAFNSYYERRARRINLSARENIMPEAKREFSGCKRQGLPFGMYTVAFSYETTFISEKYLSLCTRLFTYSGGAHGYTEMRGDVWSLQRAERVALSEISPILDIKKCIMTSVKAAIAADSSGKYFSDADKAAERTFSMKNYYLTDEGISVFFPLYALAPYYAGIQAFKTGLMPI